MQKRIKSDHEIFVRKVLQKGANKLMRQSGFKRPGGGWTYYRETRESSLELTHQLEVSNTWSRRRQVGELVLMMRVAAPQLWLRTAEARLPLDVYGDAGDLAVSVFHWLRTEGLPWFDRAVDLEALARESEANGLKDVARWDVVQRHLRRCATLWELAGRPDEAARLIACLTPLPPGSGEDQPF